MNQLGEVDGQPALLTDLTPKDAREVEYLLYVLKQRVLPQQFAKEMAQNILGAAQQPIPNENTDLVELDANKESSITGKAREQARETTEVQ